TTANFLLSLAFPKLTKKIHLNFSDIEDALIEEKVDLGLIIHENRFTYTEKGLHKIMDLGDYWEKRTGYPIPLGGIVINRNIDSKVQHTVNRVLRKSVEYAFAHPHSGIEFIKLHAQEMSEEVMYKHIDLYVNEFSVDLGTIGRNAIKTLFKQATDLSIVPKLENNIFLS